MSTHPRPASPLHSLSTGGRQLKGRHFCLSLLQKKKLLFNLPKCLTHSLKINQPTQRYPGPTSVALRSHKDKSFLAPEVDLPDPVCTRRTFVTFEKHYRPGLALDRPWTTSQQTPKPSSAVRQTQGLFWEAGPGSVCQSVQLCLSRGWGSGGSGVESLMLRSRLEGHSQRGRQQPQSPEDAAPQNRRVTPGC